MFGKTIGRCEVLTVTDNGKFGKERLALRLKVQAASCRFDRRGKMPHVLYAQADNRTPTADAGHGTDLALPRV